MKISELVNSIKKRPIQFNSTQFMSWNQLNWACFFRVDELGRVESRKFSELISWIKSNRAKFVNSHELNWIQLKKKSYNQGIKLNSGNFSKIAELHWVESKSVFQGPRILFNSTQKNFLLIYRKNEVRKKKTNKKNHHGLFCSVTLYAGTSFL
jgi:hypothetical protein